MRRDLVERRQVISETDYNVGLALAQLAPGPLAAQLCFYIGFVEHRILGATAAGIAFVLPSFVMVLGLAVAYVAYEGLPAIQAIFYGVGSAVIGIIAYHAYRLTTKTVARDPLLWFIFLGIATVTVLTESERIELFVGAGVLVWLVRAPPRLGRAGVGLLAPFPVAMIQASEPSILWTIAGFFAKAGAFVFGSGLAIVPFLYAGVVQEHGWLTDRQFLDAVAVALITPGPVVITTAFIGFLVAGFPGATIAAAATFLPAYLLTIIPAPYFRRHGQRPAIAAFVEGVTAAAIGAITGAVIVLGRRAIVDAPTALIAAAALAALSFGRGRAREPLVVAISAGLGLVIHPLLR